MTFLELQQAFGQVTCEERREQTEAYLEVVVSRKDMPDAAAVLQSYFGPPLKPEGQKPSREVSLLADPYGGIRGNQTLYAVQGEEGQAMALLWPWSGGDLITIKVVLDAGKRGGS